jgi:serine/threonine-protein kinase
MAAALGDAPAASTPIQPPSETQGYSQPQRFGDYELLECIASGGMGVVYKARHMRLGRMVAIKTLPFGRFTRDSYVQRFQAEAAAAARLRHPHIVAIHEVGDHAGQPWFAMDYIDGLSLADLIREQPLPMKRAVRFLRTIAEAVHYAHGMGILHRDLKPSNILLDSLDQPHVTDFGLAKDLKSQSELTLTGETLGSPNYIPPEQIDGKRGTAGPHTDIYSLGAVLYHLLTGRPPFVGESLTATLQQVATAEPVAPRLLNPAISRDLETICLKCLEKEPSKRYPTAQELAEQTYLYEGDIE